MRGPSVRRGCENKAVDEESGGGRGGCDQMVYVGENKGSLISQGKQYKESSGETDMS